ncbi:gp042 [Rhodococcus phage ReqiPepy6]|uniref:Gp042 n=1 Tax=Rhodococcus phage ReqiPepy6 TaxID=691965 RepID=D4P7F3_9CAUD|nr:gp042 [Rhodococcus phage ReqiPepy6]ADD80933.1 gp042 [Rhodococcus phage ReqiPepy6]
MTNKLFVLTNTLVAYTTSDYAFGIVVGVTATHIYFKTKYKAMLTPHDMDRLKMGLPVQLDTSQGPLYIKGI